MKREGCFTRTFWAINFNHATFGQATTKGNIQCHGPSRNGLHAHPSSITQPHDRPFAKGFLDLIQD
jgi:hypothetical protein